MSASIRLDPSRGFVALPLDVLEIEMSPGAFRTLVEFCRMADSDGVCWPSLEQIGTRLSRSRAAISGYVRELRELALVETEAQKAANGYNYRLRFRVTFWRAWKARFRRPGQGAAPERRVQPTKRLENENQIQQNHSGDRRSPEVPEIRMLNAQWQAHIGHAPYPAFEAPPSEALVERTARLAPPRASVSADMKPALTAFFADIHPTPPAAALADLVRIADRIAVLPDAPDLLHRALRSAWKPHWAHPPSAAFVERIVARIAAAHPAPLAIRVLAGHLRRWDLCRKSLRGAA